jgi:lipopolysaccharide export system protein LptA
MKSPAWQSSTWLVVLALLAFSPVSAPLQAADKTPASPKAAATHSSKGKKAAKAEPAEPVVGVQKGLGAMGSMIPEGMRNLKARIPGFQSGRQSSLITAEAITRQKDQTLFAEKMVIHMYAVKPEENVRVDMRSATYDLQSQVLTSQERSRVSRKDFQIEGDSMVFDTTTSQGKMVGRVQMIIYDASNLAQPTSENPTSETAPLKPAASPLPATQNAK